MTTIPQRLREIARNGPFDERRSAIFKLADEIAAELEEPAADAKYTPPVPGLYWCSDLTRLSGDASGYVPVGDHLATVAALQRQLGECSGGYETMEREVAALQARINALEARQDVPEDVLDAVKRMSQPIDPSWGIPAATAEADARCMRLISDFVLSLTQQDTSKEQP